MNGVQTTHDAVARRWGELGERNGLYVFGDTATDAAGREWDFLAATFDQYDRACLLKGTEFSFTRGPSSSWNDLKELGLLPEPETRPIRDWPGAEVIYYEDLGFFVLTVDGVAREFFLMTLESADATWGATDEAN